MKKQELKLNQPMDFISASVQYEYSDDNYQFECILLPFFAIETDECDHRDMVENMIIDLQLSFKQETYDKIKTNYDECRRELTNIPFTQKLLKETIDKCLSEGNIVPSKNKKLHITTIQKQVVEFAEKDGEISAVFLEDKYLSIERHTP